MFLFVAEHNHSNRFLYVFHLQSGEKIIWTTAKKTALSLTPQAMQKQFKRPSAGSVRELYYIYRNS